MAKIAITIGPDAFEERHFLSVWFRLNPNREPFYVGETSKSPADGVELHIRKSGGASCAGAVVGTLMHSGNWPTQAYTVLPFPV
jgi:hypothetical protein